MSRCFAYPPPGYSLNRDSKDALIETIKLQSEKEMAKDKELRKEKKREKKEKREEKKERKKEKKERKEEKKKKALQNFDNSAVAKLHAGEKSCAGDNAKFISKVSEAESEQLERSSLTEERGPPVPLLAPSSSADSTENSKKRKRQLSLGDVANDRGKVIRIRLSKKQSDSTVSVSEQQLCSTSGRTELPSQGKEQACPSLRKEDFSRTSAETRKVEFSSTHANDREHVCSSSRTTGSVVIRKTGIPPVGNNFNMGSDSVVIRKTGIPPVGNKVISPMQKLELQYKNLTAGWIPPQLQDVAPVVLDDMDWLFKGTKNPVGERRTSGNDSFLSSSITSWSRAQYLPEVDLYALPYTGPL